MKMDYNCILKKSVWPISLIVYLDMTRQVDTKMIRKVRLNTQNVINSQIDLKNFIFNAIETKHNEYG
jgi:hypothetical protein